MKKIFNYIFVIYCCSFVNFSYAQNSDTTQIEKEKTDKKVGKFFKKMGKGIKNYVDENFETTKTDSGFRVTNSKNRNKTKTSKSSNATTFEHLGEISSETYQQLLLRYIREQNVEGMKKAISLGANPNFGISREAVNTPMFTAILTNCIECEEYLITQIKDVNATLSYGGSILVNKCKKSYIDCKECIEEWGVNPNLHIAPNNIFRFIHPAGNEKTIEYLLSKGVNPTQGQYTVLGIYLNAMSPELFEIFLKKGLNKYINRKINSSYDYPLGEIIIRHRQRYQKKEDRLKKAEILLKNGANPNICISDIGSLLYKVVVRMENYEYTKLLLEYGADPNIGRSCSDVK